MEGFTFEAPLKIASAENGDTDIDESDSEFSSGSSSSTAESSLTDSEVRNENSKRPMLVDASDDEDKDELEQRTLLSTSTPLAKPILKRDSSVRSALEFAKQHKESNIGLLKYFSQGTKDDVDTYWKKEEERTAVNQEKRNFKEKSANMEKKQHKRELARIRQQRKRDRIKKKEVKEGVRSPGGKKRKVNQNLPTKTKLITRPGPRSLTWTFVMLPIQLQKNLKETLLS